MKNNADRSNMVLSSLKSLKKIYEYESSKLDGPGSYRKDINDIAWSLDDLISKGVIEEDERSPVKDLVERMLEVNEALLLAGDDRDRYVTRVCETARLLGHNYEYWHQGRPGVAAIRWLVESKTVPRRDIRPEDFVDMVCQALTKSLGKDDRTERLKVAVDLVINSIGKTLPGGTDEARFSQFQLDATIEMLLAQYKNDHGYRCQIMTAGVGSGKTIAFTIALLVSVVERHISGDDEEQCHLLLYPRTALAKDQYDTIAAMMDSLDIVTLNGPSGVHLEHGDQYKKMGTTVKKGVEDVYRVGKRRPSLIITTLETLNRRLQRPEFINYIRNCLCRVVVDEIHLVEGMTGSNIVQVLSRLQASCGNRKILWTAASATIADPDQHCSKVFGVKKDDVIIIAPGKEDLDEVGLVHHIFLKPSGIISTLGSLVNTTSILVHNRRDDLGSHGQNGKIERTMGFADNLDIIGRWNADLRENERTEEQSNSNNSRTHPRREDIRSWGPRQRELPYALRFHNPMQRRIEARGGRGEPYRDVLNEWRGKDVCTRCRSGERFVLKENCSAEEMRELGKMAYRYVWKEDDNVRTFYIDNPIFNDANQKVGTRDMCPFLRAGACFLFSRDDLRTEEISDGTWEWQCVVRSKIHTSKTKKDQEGLDDDLGDEVFKASKREVYDINFGPGSREEIPVDVVIASPSLEVGVDLLYVTESVMFKAIRNVASYRQKAGRVGREIGSDVVNVTLVSNKPIDLHYYRQPRKLVSRGHLDPIPLKELNEMVLKWALYMAVWDHLALEGRLPEAIPTNWTGERTEFFERLNICKEHLLKHRERVKDHLRAVARGRYDRGDAIIENAICQVEREIGLFIRSTKGIIENPEIRTVADLIVHTLNSHGIRPNYSKSAVPIELDNGSKEYLNRRTQVNPIKLDLSEEFRKLDILSNSGWCDLVMVSDIKRSIDARLAEIGDLERNGSDEDRSNIRAVRKISSSALVDIIEALEDVIHQGKDPYALEFCRSFAKHNADFKGRFHYLSYILEEMKIFELLRPDMAYVRPKNLFTSPYEDGVRLAGSGVNQTVSLQEALQDFVPGTWTYRLGKTPVKTSVGQLTPWEGNLLEANALLSLNDSRFVKLKDQVPGPPHLPGSTFTLYRPIELRVRSCQKYLSPNLSRLTILDGDEDSLDDDGEEGSTGRDLMRIRTKIPTSYPQRWVHIDADEGSEVLCHDLDKERMVLEKDSSKLLGEDARTSIRHPLHANHISSIKWHQNLTVYDYVYSVSRSYSSRDINGVNIVFKNGMEDLAIGRKFESEGVSLELNAENFDRVVKEVRQGIERNDDLWAPSSLKALTASISSLKLENNVKISAFVLRDLVGILLASIMTGRVPDHAPDLNEKLQALFKDPVRLMDIARRYFQARNRLNPENDGELNTDVERNVDAVIKTAEMLEGKLDEVMGGVEDWVRTTLLNSFGVVAYNALTRLSGTRDGEIGYTIDVEGAKIGIYRIFLYDATPRGNGSSEVLSRYLHILNVQRRTRNGRESLLPTQDFLDILEQGLMQCPQYQTDMDALEKFAQSATGQKSIGIPELGYLKKDSDEVLRTSLRTWAALGIKGRNDAWKLPLIALTNGAAGAFVGGGLDPDDIQRASNICWNGCPECVVNNDILGGPMSNNYLDKMVLDLWFTTGMSMTTEYLQTGVGDLLGAPTVDFGHLSMLYMDLPDRILRSVSLPYSLGFGLDRKGKETHPSILLRNDDISDLKLFKGGSQNIAVSIGSHGFKRLVWYSLLTSLYLDCMGLIPEKERRIELVYYDCRDLDFEDVGFSERMLDAIEAQRINEGASATIQTLSDVLGWASMRGFDVIVCVDEYQSHERPVEEFLELIRRKSGGRATLLTKSLGGSMHKKILTTPAGCINGSANLTSSGSGYNEEDIAFTPRKVPEFDKVRMSVKDTISKAKPYVDIANRARRN